MKRWIATAVAVPFLGCATAFDADTGICLAEVEVGVTGGRVDHSGAFALPKDPWNRAGSKNETWGRSGGVFGELRLRFDPTRLKCKRSRRLDPLPADPRVAQRCVADPDAAGCDK